VLVLILVVMLLTPLLGSSFYAAEIKQFDNFGNQIPSKSEPEQYVMVLLPIFVFGVIGLVGMSISYVNALRRFARSGLIKNCKVWVFAILPMVFLLAFGVIVLGKMQDNDVEEGPQRFNWWFASVAQFLFCGIVSIQLKQISYAMGMMAWMLTLPLTIFSFMMSLSLEEIITIPSRYLLYAPLMLWGLMLLVFRALVPYLREAKY